MSLNKKTLVSVIVPVFNAEEYLDDCLISIINQTYKNIEIILVDDKSTDRSLDIAKKWQKLDVRIKIIPKKKNQGINPARKTGFENSIGEYIMFVDDDDIITNDLIYDHLNIIEETGADISIGKAVWWDTKDTLDIKEYSNNTKAEIKVLNKKLSYRCLITETSPFAETEVGILWNKLHKRQLFNDYNWTLSNMPAEDFMTSAYIFNNVEKVVFINRVYYYHRINNASTMNQLSQKKGANVKHDIDIFDALYKVAHVFEDISNKNKWGFKNEILYFKYRYFFIRINAFISKNSFTDKDYMKVKKYISEKEISLLTTSEYQQYIQQFVHEPAASILMGIIDFWSDVSKSKNLNSFLQKQINKENNEINQQKNQIFLLEEKLKAKTAILDDIQTLRGSTFNFAGKIKHRILKAPLKGLSNKLEEHKIKKLNKKYKNCWLVMDRKETASDNGYVFYDFLLKKHPEKNAFFVIEKDSTDVQKLRKKGFRLVYVDTLDHKIALKNSIKLIYAYFTFEYSNNSAQRVFLSHGIAKDNLPNPGIRKNDFFITTLKEEQDWFSERVDLKAIRTGMPRYDRLLKEKNEHETNKEYIVIAPTWRGWLYNESAKIIKEDDFFINWQRLLLSKQIKELSDKNRIIFLTHPMMIDSSNKEKQKSIFKCPKYISTYTYESLGLEGFQELLLKTKLLVTDYSSVAFDAAIAGSNVLYFQFDEKKYRTVGHLKKGWFDYSRNGFGPVCYSYNEFINNLNTFSADKKVYDRRKKNLIAETENMGSAAEEIFHLLTNNEK